MRARRKTRRSQPRRGDQDFVRRLAGVGWSVCHRLSSSRPMWFPLAPLTACSTVVARVEATTWADNEVVFRTSAGRAPNPDDLHSREQQGLGAASRARSRRREALPRPRGLSGARHWPRPGRAPARRRIRSRSHGTRAASSRRSRSSATRSGRTQNQTTASRSRSRLSPSVSGG